MANPNWSLRWMLLAISKQSSEAVVAESLSTLTLLPSANDTGNIILLRAFAA